MTAPNASLRALGPFQVSSLCLGSMTWGEQNDREQAFLQLDYALDQGINFIDVAELYPTPPREETYNRTEEILGEYLESRGARERIVLATKIAGPSEKLTWIRGGKSFFNRPNLEQALEGSLRRLRTDRIDLYQLHWPDRIANFFGKREYPYVEKEGWSGTPAAETLEILGEMIEKGKIRAYGLSNETPWGLSSFLRAADALGLPRPVSIQNPYSLLNRQYEIGLSEFAHREGVGLLAYSPLAFGLLSGKYLEEEKPAGARLTLFGKHFKRYSGARALEATRRYVALAKERGISPARMALAFTLRKPFLKSAIIGATNLEQLQENISARDLTLDRALLKELDKIHSDLPDPAP